MYIGREMDKKDVVHIYNKILLGHKEEQNNAICSNMDGPRDYHTKWSKSDEERQISYDITHMWNLILKNDTNELIYKTETELFVFTDFENKHSYQGKQWGEG